MQVTYINEKDAPQPPAPMSKGLAESVAVLQSLKKGQVAAITPDDGQTLRGLKASYGRAAKKAQLKVTRWDVNNVLYIKLA